MVAETKDGQTKYCQVCECEARHGHCRHSLDKHTCGRDYTGTMSFTVKSDSERITDLYSDVWTLQIRQTLLAIAVLILLAVVLIK